MGFDNSVVEEIKKLPGAVGVAIVTRDGIPLGTKLPEYMHIETFAIMSATMLGAAMTANSELKRSGFLKLIVETTDGNILLYSMGVDNLLVIVSDKTSSDSQWSSFLESVEKHILKLR